MDENWLKNTANEKSKLVNTDKDHWRCPALPTALDSQNFFIT